MKYRMVVSNSPLSCRTTPPREVCIVPLHHKGKLCSTCQVAYYFFQLVYTCNFCCPLDLSIILLQQGFPRWTCPWYLSCVFTYEVALDSTQITVAVWIRGFPRIMLVKNAESIESAITFTAHSTDSDNKVLSLEKENCTHGTLCSFSLVDI